MIRFIPEQKFCNDSDETKHTLMKFTHMNIIFTRFEMSKRIYKRSASFAYRHNFPQFNQKNVYNGELVRSLSHITQIGSKSYGFISIRMTFVV